MEILIGIALVALTASPVLTIVVMARSFARVMNKGLDRYFAGRIVGGKPADIYERELRMAEKATDQQAEKERIILEQASQEAFVRNPFSGRVEDHHQ